MLCFLPDSDLSSMLIYPIAMFFVVSFTQEVYRSAGNISAIASWMKTPKTFDGSGFMVSTKSIRSVFEDPEANWDQRQCSSAI